MVDQAASSTASGSSFACSINGSHAFLVNLPAVRPPWVHGAHRGLHVLEVDNGRLAAQINSSVAQTRLPPSGLDERTPTATTPSSLYPRRLSCYLGSFLVFREYFAVCVSFVAVDHNFLTTKKRVGFFAENVLWVGSG